MTSDLYDELSGDQIPLSTPKRVMTIGAHPDDAEFGAGACLARWATRGAQIAMLIVTDGSKGSWNPDEDKAQLVQQRKDEQSRAADVLGATSVVHLDHVDGELEYTMDLRKVLARHIRAIRPDVLLTHDPWQRYQLHPDHRATGLAAVDAVVAAREPLMFPELAEPAHRPGVVLLWSADEPDHAEPVDSEWFDKKVEALLCHSSQGATTMGGAESGAEKRVAFIDHLALWHANNGDVFGVGPAESFKKIVP
jgi:LmbE family N-acetylglucosaminyl deacetylase